MSCARRSDECAAALALYAVHDSGAPPLQATSLRQRAPCPSSSRVGPPGACTAFAAIKFRPGSTASQFTVREAATTSNIRPGWCDVRRHEPDAIALCDAGVASARDDDLGRAIRLLTIHGNSEGISNGARASKKIDPRRIEQLMESWGITRHELELSLRRHPLPVRVVTVSPVKYRHPVTHLTWNGTGAQPDWLRHAPLQEGYTVAQLRLDLPQPCPDPTLCDLSLAMGPGARA